MVSSFYMLYFGFMVLSHKKKQVGRHIYTDILPYNKKWSHTTEISNESNSNKHISR